MSFFKIDFENLVDMDVTEGTYEVIIRSCFRDSAKSGTEFINMQMVIRNDLDQKFKNAYVFHKIWQNKTTLQFNAYDINKIAKVLKVEEGFEFKELEDLTNFLKNKPLKVTVRKEEDPQSTNLVVKKWTSTQFPEVNHIFKENKNREFDKQPVTVNDEDLPF